jgi:CDP-glucose 4,6-dehydratase
MELKGQNVLVTGGNGFIGSHLVKHLVDNKIKVVVPYLEINRKSYFNRYNLHKKTIFIRCDLRDFKKTFNLINNNKISFIFHLAAEALVEKALDKPLDTFSTNIMGTVNVLEAARRYGKIKGIIVTSSDKAYGKIPKAKETDPVGGTHPYEISKASADLIVRGYFSTYGLPALVTRFGNVYGEGDLNFSRIIPGTLKSIICKEELQIRSDGKYIRDYVYVADVIEALLTLAKNIKMVQGEAFNISSDENLTVIKLVEKIGEILGVKVNYRILATAINEIPKQSINFRKIKRRLGWQPKNTLAGTIGQIYNWYKLYFGS